MPRLATRCLCVLSTWFVVCWCHVLPCRLSVPLPSCYLIIFQWLQLCLPRYSRLSPYIVSLCLQSCADPLSYVVWVFNVWLCSSLLPACLLVFFPLWVDFVALLFHFIILKPDFLCTWVLDLISHLTERISKDEDSAEEGFGSFTTRH